MNHHYRTLWNELTGAFVAVAENVAGRGKRSGGSKKAADGAAVAAAGAPRAGRSRLVTTPPSLLRLEPRLVFDGAALATNASVFDTVVDVSAGTVHDTSVAAVAAEAAAKAVAIEAPAMAAERLLAVDVSTVATARREVAFVDAAVQGHEALIDGLDAGIEVVLIEAGRDGLAQMADWAATHSGYDAIHVLSHGSTGALQLGTAEVNAASLANGAAGLAQQAEWAAIGHALNASGDLLVYGCRTGADGAFIDRLASLTQADVAASSDDTGAATLGGNWVLEARSGAVEARDLDLGAWPHLLGEPVTLLTVKGNLLADGLYVQGSHVASDGSLLFTGTLTKTVDFDPGPGVTALTNQLNVDSAGAIFVAKYSREGALLWARSYDAKTTSPTAYSHAGEAVISDSVGNVYVSGRWIGKNATLDFNGKDVAGGSITNPVDNSNTFLLKLGADGSYQWVNSLVTTIGGSSGANLALDSAGNVYMAGIYYGAGAKVSDGSGQVLSSWTGGAGNANHVYVAKFSSAGALVWERNALNNGGGGGDPRVQQLRVTADGDVFLSGYAFNLNAGGVTISVPAQPADFRDGFLWVLDTTGSQKILAPLGGRAAPGLGYENTSSVVEDGQGNVFIGGYFVGGSADLDPTAGQALFSSPNGLSSYIVKLDANNNFVTAKVLEPSSSSVVWRVEKLLSQADGTLLAAGLETGANVSSTLVIAAYDASLNLLWRKSIPGYSAVPLMQLDADGKLAVTFSYSGTVDTDPGTGERLLVSGAPTTVYYDEFGEVAPEPMDGGYSQQESPQALAFARWEADASGLASYGPTAGITSDRAVLNAGQTATLSITLSAPATDFTAADLAVTGGTLSNFSGSGSSYSATFTPATGFAGSADVAVARGTFTDAAGRANLASSFNLAVDTTPPHPASMAWNAADRLLTVAFDKPVLASSPPPAAAFGVTSGGVALPVTALAVVDGKVVLTLGAGTLGASLSVAYTDPSAGNDAAAVQDGAGQDAASFTQALANAAPVLTAGTTAVTYTEGGAPVVIDAGLGLADADDTFLSGARVVISAGLTAGDVLGFSAQNGISSQWDAASGTLTLGGSATVAQYQAALRAVTFSNSGDAPTANSGSRTLQWSVTDAGGPGLSAQASAAAARTLGVKGVNDAAPVLDAVKAPTLGTVVVGAAAPVAGLVPPDAVRVSQLVSLAGTPGNVADLDGDRPGIALTGVVGGTLHYTTDGGASWKAVGTVSAASALLLKDNADTWLVYRAAAGVTIGTSVADAVTFRAWDGSGNYAQGAIGVNVLGALADVGGFDTTGTGLAVATSTSGRYAYVADGAKGLQVIDLSNPAAPAAGIVLAKNPLNKNVAITASHIAVSGDWGYVAGDSGGLLVLNLGDPANPTVAGMLDTAGSATGVAVVGNTVYVADGAKGLLVIDVGNKAAPKLLGSYDTAGTAKGVAVRTVQVGGVAKTYAYVADGNANLIVLDVSTPATPTLFATVALGSGAVASRVVLAADAQTLYVAAGAAGLKVLDLSNPAATTLPVTTLDTDGTANDLAIDGSLLYVADDIKGAKVMDISARLAPVLLGSLDTAGSAEGVAALGPLLLVADGAKGLRVLRGSGLASFSVASDTAGVAVRVDTAPTLTSGFVLPAVLATRGAPVNGSTEGSTLVRTLLGNSFSDADGDAAGIGIASPPEKGTLWFSTDDGASWTPVVSAYSNKPVLLFADDRTRLYYEPAAGSTSSDAQRFNVIAWDRQGGFSNGQSVTSLTSYAYFSTGARTASVVVKGLNTAPLLARANLAPPLVPPIYDQLAGRSVVVDAYVTVTDKELAVTGNSSGEYGGSTLTLQRDTGANAGDVFGSRYFKTNGTIGIGNEPALGSYTQSAGLLTITFSAGATQGKVNLVMDSITYMNTEAAPPAGVKLAWRFNDGNSANTQGTGPALDSNVFLSNVTVMPKPVNTAPVFTDAPFTLDEIGLHFTGDFVDLGNNVQIYSFGLDTLTATTQPGADGTLDYYFAGASMGQTTGRAIPVGTGDDVALSVRLTGSGIVMAGYSDGALNEDFSVVRSGATVAEGGDGINFTAIVPVGDGDDRATTALPLAGGKTLLGGTTVNAAGDTDFALVCLDASGALDPSFGSGGKLVLRLSTGDDRINNLAVDASGRILVVGTSPDGNGKPALTLMRLQANGTPDTSFGNQGLLQFQFDANGSHGRSVTVDAAGRLIVAGYTLDAQNSADTVLLRLNADGSLDASFDQDGIKRLVEPGSNEYAGGLEVRATDFQFLFATLAHAGDIVLTSSIVSADGGNALRITVLGPDGSVVLSLSTLSSDGSGYLLSVGADGVPTLSDKPVYDQAGSPVRIDASRSVSDANLDALGSYAGATLTVQRDGIANADDQFALVEGSAYTLAANGELRNGSTVVGAYTRQSGKLTLRFGSNVPKSVVNQLLCDLTYACTATLTDPVDVTLKTSFSDGNTGQQGSGGALAANMLTTIHVQPAAPQGDASTSLMARAAAGTAAELPSTANSAAGAVEVFGFSLTDFDADRDGAADAGSSDGQATRVDVIRLQLASASTVNLGSVRLQLSGGGLAAPVEGVVQADGSIAFATPGLAVADKAHADFVVKAWVAGAVDDGAAVSVTLAGDAIQLASGGSRLAAAQSLSGSFKPTVTATRLVFDTVLPTTLINGSGSTAAVVVKAVDAAGNVDVDFTSKVSVGASGGVKLNGSSSTYATKGVAKLGQYKLIGSTDHLATALTVSATGVTGATSSAITLDAVANRLVVADSLDPVFQVSTSGQATSAQERVVSAVDTWDVVDTDFNGTLEISVRSTAMGAPAGTVNSLDVASGDLDASVTTATVRATAGVATVAAQTFSYTNAGSGDETVLVAAAGSGLGTTVLAARNSQVALPTLAFNLFNGGAVMWIEPTADSAGTSPVLIASGGIVADSAHADLLKLAATVGNARPGDALELLPAVAANLPAGLSVTGAGTATLTISGTASVADYQALLRSITYRNTLDTPDTTQRSIGISIDNGHGGQATQSVDVMVLSANDQPTLDGVPTSALTMREGVSAALDLSALGFADADAEDAPVTLTLELSGGIATLSAGNGPGVTVSGSGTGTLVLSGAANRIDTYLNQPSSIEFFSPVGFSGQITLSLTANDNGSNGLVGASGPQLVGSLRIDVTPSNVAPTLAGLPASAASTPLRVGQASALDDFTVADADGDTLNVSLSPTNGTLGGLTDSDLSTPGLQLRGTAAEINAALASATFTASAVGATGISLYLDDGRHPVNGSYLLPNAIRLNTAPTLTVPTLSTITTGVAQRITGLGVTDPDSTQTLRLTLNATNATVSGLVDADANEAGIQLLGSASTINRLLTATTTKITAGADGAVTLSLSVTDGEIASPVNAIWTLTARNSAPTLSVFTSLDIGSEDQSTAISFAKLTQAGNAADTGGAVTAFVVQAVSTGTLKIGATEATATLFATGTNDVIDAEHQAFWTPAANANGTGASALNAFTVKARDNGSTPLLSATAVQVKVAVTAVNDAPVLLAPAYSFTPVGENETAPAGERITGIWHGEVLDPDGGNAGAIGMAIVGTSGNGHWQFSTDSTNGLDGTWTDVGAVGNSSARLLAATDWLRYLPDGQHGETAAITVRAWDGSSGTAGGLGSVMVAGGASAYSASTVTFDAPVTEVDDPLSLSLSDANKATQTYAENATLVLDAGLTLNDPDTVTTLGGARAVIGSGLVTAEDQLLINGTTSGSLSLGGATIAYSYDSSTGVMALNGTASQDAYQQALQLVSYHNTSDNPTASARTIDLVAGTMLSTTLNGQVHFYEYVTADGTAAPRLSWDQAKAAAEARTYAGMRGYLVTITSQAESDFLKTRLPGSSWLGASDVTTEGTWQWVTGPEAGTPFWQVEYNFLGGISGGHAVGNAFSNWSSGEPNNWDWNLLDAIGGEDYGQITADGSGNWNDIDQTKTDYASQYRVNGYLIEYSSPTVTSVPFARTLTLTPERLNDAPVLSAASPTLTALGEDATGNAGQLVSSLVSLGTIGDADTGATRGGIAITTLDSGNGSWQYRLGNSGNWVDMGALDDSHALLLTQADAVRFVPDAKNATSASFGYRAWDQTRGTVGTTADASSVGGTSAFSNQRNTASITVTAVNDAPEIASGASAQLSGISEDLALADNAGQSVGSMLGGSYSDVDLNASSGIAITGKTEPGSGHWQYSIDNGGSWSNLGAVSDGGALLLAASDKLRFAPDGQFGGNATLTLRGWDASSGAHGQTVSVTSNGGSTAFSTRSASLTLDVQSVNDAAVLGASGGNAAYTEGNAAVFIDAGLALSDDSATFSAAQVRIEAGFSTGDALNFTAQNGISGNWNADTGVLSLSGSASPADWQTALRSITFSSTSDDPTALGASRTIRWQATDAEGLISNSVTRTLALTATADQATLTRAPTSFDYTEDDGARVLAPDLVIADSDDIALAGARVTLDTASSGFSAGGERLGLADTALMSVRGNDWTATVGAISLSYTGSTGVLQLTGTASVTEYQNLLRGVTYGNVQDYQGNGATLAGNASRSVTWQVTDANSDGAGAATSLVATTAIALHDANEIPQVLHANDATRFYTENASAVVLAPTLGALDNSGTNSGSLDGALVRIGAGFTAGDTLTWSAVDGISGVWDAATGTLSLSGTAGIGSYETALRSVSFSSTSDNPTASSTSRTIHWQIRDGAGTPSAIDAGATTTLTITAINDAGSAAGLAGSASISVDERGAAVSVGSQLQLSDADDTRLSAATVVLGGIGFDAGHEVLLLAGQLSSTGSMAPGLDWTVNDVAGSGVAARYVASTGTLTLSGTASVEQYQQLLRRVSYRNDAVDPTVVAATRSLGWTVTDADGTAAANGAQTSAAATSGVTVRPLNDATTLAGLPVNVIAVTEGTPVQPGGAVTLADADDSQLASAKVWISAGFASGDQLSFSGPAGISGSFDAATGVLTLSGTASVADYQAALRSIRYATGDEPTLASSEREISWQLVDADSDGAGAASSAIASVRLAITAVNDAPVIAGSATPSFTEGGAAVVLDAGLTLGDADDRDLGGATVTIASGLTSGDVLSFTAQGGISGSFNAVTGVLTLGGNASVAAYQAALRSVSFSNTSGEPTGNGTAPSRGIRWAVTDAGRDGTGAATGNATSSVAVHAVNAGAVLHAGGTLAYSEGSAAAVLDAGITLADADDTQMSGATLSISSGHAVGDELGFIDQNGIAGSWNTGTGVLTLSGRASVADYQAALRSVKFSSSSDDPTATSAVRQISIELIDADSDGAGAAHSNIASTNVVLTAVNDAPQASGQGLGPTWTEGDPARVLSPGLLLGDADDALLSAAYVQIASPVKGDALSWNGAVLIDTGISARYDAGTGLLSLGGNATLAAYQAVLRTVAFSNEASDSTADGSRLTRQIDWTLRDADGHGLGAQDSAAVRTLLTVTARNSAPEIGLAAAGGSWIEGDAAAVANSTLSLSDSDSSRLSGATVAITAGYSGGDALYFVDQNGIAGSWDAGTGVLTLSGEAGIAAYQDALRSVRFASSSEHPDAQAATRTLSWTVTDQDVSAPATSTLATSTLAVAGVNDVPTLTAFAGAATSGAEDSAIAIALADLLAQGNEADADGRVSAFRVDAVTRGTLRIGATEATATAWAAGSNDTVDASHGAWWTPDADTNSHNQGQTPIAAFNVVAVDDQGEESATPTPVRVDVTRVADAAVVTAVGAPPAGTYAAGEAIDFSVRFDRAVAVDTRGGTPYLDLAVGADSLRALWVGGSGTNTQVFRLTVPVGGLDSDGVALGGGIVANGATLRNSDDGQTTDAELALQAVAGTADVRVDGVAPVVQSIASSSTVNTAHTTATFTVTFSEAVRGVDASDFALDALGTAGGRVSAVSAIDPVDGAARQYSVTVSELRGSGSLRLDLDTGSTGIKDLAGNRAAGFSAGVRLDVDTEAPMLAFGTIAQDGVLNAAEAAGNVLLSGRSAGLADGRVVAVSVGGQVHLASVSANTWSVSVAAAEAQAWAQGALAIGATAVDAADNPGSAQATLQVDTAAPTLTIAAVALDDRINAAEAGGTVRVSGTTTAEAGQTLTVYLGSVAKTVTPSGSDWQADFSAADLATLDDADKLLVSASVNDAAGNPATAERSIVLDRVAPVLALGTVSGDNRLGIDEAAAALTLQGTAAGLSDGESLTLNLGTLGSRTVTVNSGAWSLALTAAEVQSLAEGALTLSADARDPSGNAAAQATATVTIDRTAPVLTLDAVAGDDVINLVEHDGGFVLSGTTSEGRFVVLDIGTTTGVSCLVDADGRWSTWISAAELPAVTANAVPVTLRVTDASGNVGTLQRTVAMDAVTPATPTLALQDDSGLSATDRLTRLATLKLSGAESGARLLYTVNGELTDDPQRAMVAGVNTVSVRQLDAAGNLSAASEAFTFTLDGDAPVIGSAAAQTVDENTATLYTAQAGDHSAVTYRLQPGVGDAALLNIDATTGVVTLNDAATTDYEGDQRSYRFTIVATDAAGNASQQGVIVQLANVNDTAPVLTLASASVELAEDAPAGVIAGAQAIASDADGDTPVFSLVDAPVDAQGQALFAVDAATGQVSLTPAGAAVLDFEGPQRSYALQIRCGDGAAGHDRVVTLTVNVADVLEPVAPLMPAVLPAVAAPLPVFEAPLPAFEAPRLTALTEPVALRIELPAPPVLTTRGFPVAVDRAVTPGVREGLWLEASPSEQVLNTARDGLRFAVPAGTFGHSDPAALLSLTATLADGSPLPAWLAFDPAKGEFSGRPPEGFAGELVLKLVVRDDSGRQVETTMRIIVKPRTDEKSAKAGRISLNAQFQRQGVFAWKAERDRLVQQARGAEQGLRAGTARRA